MSSTLTRGDWAPVSLLAAGLVDTMRLAVAPAVVGQGRRLLSRPDIDLGFESVEHRATPTGVLVLEYATIGSAPRDDYAGVTDLI